MKDALNFEALVASPAPVILLEGTRELPLEHAPLLTAFARLVAERLPQARFRTGNAPGADEAFADGVLQVDATRLEYIVPHALHRTRQRRPEARSVALDQLAEETLQILLRETQRATPAYAPLIGQRKNPRIQIKLDYLLRDTLKVMGASEIALAPATFGIFYVNVSNPAKGGTGHTMRVCEVQSVPFWTQEQWLHRPE